MAIAHVQSKGAQSSGSVATLGLTLDASTTSGNLVLVGQDRRLGATWTITDDASNTYTEDIVKLETNFSTYASAISHTYAGTTATLTITMDETSNRYMAMGVSEFSGVNSGVAPQTSSAEGISTTPAPGALTAAGDGALYFAVTCHAEASTTITPGAGWLAGYTVAAGADIPVSAVYQIQVTAASLNAGWTFGASKTWPAVMAVFEATAAAGGGPGRILKGGNSLLTYGGNLLSTTI